MSAFARWKRLGTSLFAVSAVVALGPSPTFGAMEKLTDVRIALGWVRNGQYGALLLADANGYFAREGLRVSFIDGGPGKNPVPLVAVGQAQFGVTRGPDIFNARVAPVPVNVMAVGAIVQQDPVVFLTLQDKSAPPPSPRDMEGKTIGVQPGTDFVLRGLAAKSGLDFKKFKFVTVGATAEPLLAGQVDYYTAISTNQVFQVEQALASPDAPANLKGKTLRQIKLFESGVPSYADVIFVASATVQANPDMIRRFVSAVAQGVKFMVDNPGEAATIVAKYPGQIEDRSKLAWRFDIQRKISVSKDTVERGYLWMDAGIWNESMRLYVETGQVNRQLPAEDYSTNAFSPGLKSAGP